MKLRNNMKQVSDNRYCISGVLGLALEKSGMNFM